MRQVRDDLPTFVAQWQYSREFGGVYLNTYSQLGRIQHVPDDAVAYSSERYRRDGFDVRELAGPLVVDLATFLHRCGAWEQLSLP